MRRWLFLSCIWAATAAAQVDLPDAGLPDGSVGGSGAERASEEEEDGLDHPCVLDRDCDRGFRCEAGRCTWQRYRDATFVGCATATTTDPTLALGLLVLVRRYFLAKRTK
jgi:hypothetical protein